MGVCSLPFLGTLGRTLMLLLAHWGQFLECFKLTGLGHEVLV